MWSLYNKFIYISVISRKILIGIYKIIFAQCAGFIILKTPPGDPSLHYLQFYTDVMPAAADPIFSISNTDLSILFKLSASAPPEMIPLSGGFPNPAMFPFTKTVIETSDGMYSILYTVCIFFIQFYWFPDTSLF